MSHAIAPQAAESQSSAFVRLIRSVASSAGFGIHAASNDTQSDLVAVLRLVPRFCDFPSSGLMLTI